SVLGFFTFNYGSLLPTGSVITATATRVSTGDTSEFSRAATVQRGPTLVTNTNDSGAGSLRDAITNANADLTTDTIVFNIPTSDPRYNASTGVFTINTASALPRINTQVIIDGTTQTGFTGDTNHLGPEILINGTGA